MDAQFSVVLYGRYQELLLTGRASHEGVAYQNFDSTQVKLVSDLAELDVLLSEFEDLLQSLLVGLRTFAPSQAGLNVQGYVSERVIGSAKVTHIETLGALQPFEF